jgi:putative hemolysin
MVQITLQRLLQKTVNKKPSSSVQSTLDAFKNFVKTQDSPLAGPLAQTRLSAQFCGSASSLNKIYRLRYSIFTKEYGAQIKSLRRHDKDRYDPFCDHLAVKTAARNRIVGYTRVLPYAASQRLGSFYTESEFDIGSLQHLLPESAEIGRTCIHPDFRNGATIATLWSCLARYLQDNGIRYLFGCASIGLRDCGARANSILKLLEDKGAFDHTLNIKPRLPLDASLKLKSLTTDKISLPPLLKAYISMGARVAPIPHWDTDFNVADLFILLDTNNLNPRYLKRFMKAATV